MAINGNDQWSGMLPAPLSQGNDGPFVTLHRARDAVRKLRAKDFNGAVTVWVRGGVYRLEETLVLDPEDSGTEDHPLMFKAYNNENPILSGSMKVEGFESFKGPIFKADLSRVAASAPHRQIFADGKRQVLARYPNIDPLDPISGGFLYVESPVEKGSKRKFRYRQGDVKAWNNPQDAEVFIFPGFNWGGSSRTISAMDRNHRSIELLQDAANVILTGNRYYFQNLLEELDSPGEWYLDRKTNTLYFWPVDEKALKTVTVPVLRTILEIRAKRMGTRYMGKPAHIRFEGFSFEGCEGSAIVIRNAEKTVIARSTIFNVGGNGIEIHDGSENKAVGNDIRDIGRTGIVISGGDISTLTPSNHRAENNHIHDTGVFEKGGASGILCRGVGNTVAHNLIHSMPRAGVWLDGNDNLIEYNHIHHVNLETQDSGIIYFGNVDWTKRGNVIRHNYLHDSGGYGRHKATEVFRSRVETYGVYLDDWSSGTTVYGNIIADTANGAVFIHGGRDNNIENNIIIEGGRAGQMIYSAWLPDHPTSKKHLPLMYAKVKNMVSRYPQLSTIVDVSTGAKMSGNSFIRNIVAYKDRSAPLYGIYNDIDLATTIADFNVIHHYGLPLLIPFIKAPADKQWNLWKSKGLDRHSIIADPMFSNLSKGDYRLADASPACKLGFKPIPFYKIGPYRDSLRTSWPLRSPSITTNRESLQ